MSLLTNIRFWVLVATFLLAVLIYFFVNSNYPVYLQPQRLTQFYALATVTYLYFTLLASPLVRAFPFLPYRGQYLKARRALGVSAFLFAAIHARNALFSLLGGIPGVLSLTGNSLIAVAFGVLSLSILTLMAATASDYMVEKITYPRWKTLHRFVYLVGILVIIHATTMGEHFQSLSGIIPIIFILMLTFLLILEAKRFITWLQKR